MEKEMEIKGNQPTNQEEPCLENDDELKSRMTSAPKVKTVYFPISRELRHPTPSPFSVH